MFNNVFLKTLRDRRQSFFWWALGIGSLIILMLAFYPSMHKSAAQINKLIEAYPSELMQAFFGDVMDVSSPVGFINTYFFNTYFPLLLLFFTIGFGSRAIAGEEEAGTLDILLASPLPRWRLVLEKFAALVAASIIQVVIALVIILVQAPLVNLHVDTSNLVQAMIVLTLFILFFGALALAVGCATGKRGLSIGLTTTVAVGGYFLYNFGNMVKKLRPYRKLSPFYYYLQAEPLRNGIDPGHTAVLVGCIILFLAIALITFEQRDLSV